MSNVAEIWERDHFDTGSTRVNMAGYKLMDKDWHKIVNELDLPQLICPYCSWLMKEPMASPCSHKFCRGCLFESISESNSSRNSSVAVCPVDGKEFLLQEIVPDEEADDVIKSLHISCTYKCDNGNLCEWYGLVRHLEIHRKIYHCKGEASAKELGETKKAPQHDTQLNPAPSPNWPEAAIAGPSGVFLLNPQERPQDDPLISSSSCCDNPTYVLPKSNGDQSLREVAQTLMCQQSTIKCLNQQIASLSATVQVLEQRQSLDRTDVVQIKRQLEALGHAVVTRKRDYEQLQDKVQALQNMDQSEQLQRQLAALDDTPSTVTRQVERLQEEVRKEFGQIKVMEQ